MGNEKYLSALNKVHTLSVGLKAYLDTILKTEIYEKNRKISLSKNTFNYYSFIMKGAAKLIAFDPISERETCLTFFFENDFIGHLNYIKGEFLENLQLEFLEETHLQTIAEKHIVNIFKLFPESNYLDFKISAFQLGRLLDQLYIRNYYLAKEKYKMVLKLQPEIGTKIQIKDIATFLGVDNKTLSRIRAKK